MRRRGRHRQLRPEDLLDLGEDLDRLDGIAAQGEVVILWPGPAPRALPRSHISERAQSIIRSDVPTQSSIRNTPSHNGCIMVKLQVARVITARLLSGVAA